MPPTARLTLLDGFELVCDGSVVTLPRALQRVLAFLGLRRGPNRAYVAGILWPETTEENAFSNLRTALWRLQRRNAAVVHTHGDTIRLADQVLVDVDDLVDTARTLRTSGPGELLPGWYEDWVLIERERLRQLRLHTLEDLARECLRADRCGDALQAALAAMRDEPLRESPHRLVIEAHLAEGNPCEALRAYTAYQDLLHRELGLTASPAMRQLMANIQSGV